ncbi:hypothetical protein EMIT0P74_30105 [Pseudomonas sp. IT-P74]
MNTSTQPADGAGRSRSRSRAAGELTLGLMSGEERGVYADLPLLSVGAMAACQPTNSFRMSPAQL